jgi:hypothetical protein
MSSGGRRIPLPKTRLRRVVYSVLTVFAAMLVGTVGFHYIEGMSYVNAVYFESMLATGQGPPLQLNTDTGKIFASIMAFVSVGSVLTTVVFTLGPMLTQIWREGLEHAEQDARTIESEVKRRVEEEVAKRRHEA